MAFYHQVNVFICTGKLIYKDLYQMHVETGLSPVLTLEICMCGQKGIIYFVILKNVQGKGDKNDSDG